VKKIILNDIKSYYSKKIIEHGPTPQGVDWKDENTQHIRLSQITRFLPHSSFSISDVGCGYGALFQYLQENHSHFDYHGFDLSQDMIDQAKIKFPEGDTSSFATVTSNSEILTSEFLVANGLFNLKFEHNNEDWLEFIYNSMTDFFKKCDKAMAISFLTSYNDPEFRRPNLYYADPCQLYDYAMKKLSRQSSILSDYPLYEFTLLVRK